MNNFLDSEAGQTSAFIAATLGTITLACIGILTSIQINDNATHKNDMEKYQLVTECRMKATDPDKICGKLPNLGNTENN